MNKVDCFNAKARDVFFNEATSFRNRGKRCDGPVFARLRDLRLHLGPRREVFAVQGFRTLPDRQRDRLDGPAVIAYVADGKKKFLKQTYLTYCE